VIAGRYELGAVLGTGGMARVFAGHDLRLDRPVAVKLVWAGAIDRAERERFRREARASAGFSHPNAVAIYDAGEDREELYLVMELVDGPSLATRLLGGRLAVGEALAIADGVLAALAAAHAAGIVHRDVKPGNVLLGRGGTVKLADFGIARRLDERADLTTVGTFVGTAKYTAPEQINGEPTTPATDLYAVGIVLYEMLAGAAPYDGPTPMATAIAQQTAPIPDLRTVRPDAPPAVVRAVARAMAKRPGDRFGSAAEMRAALVAGATGAGAGAAPTARYRRPATASAPHRRRGRQVVVASLVAAAVVVAVTGLVVASLRFGRDGEAATVTTNTTTAATASQTVAPTTVPPTTVATTPPTTAPPTTDPATTDPPTTEAVDTENPQTVGQLIVLIDAVPGLFGDHADEVRSALEKIGKGPDDAKRASRLLEQARRWADEGELDPTALMLMRLVLDPIAEGD
jgi:eukaryotic-like serine/threonine-protein kinase